MLSSFCAQCCKHRDVGFMQTAVPPAAPSIYPTLQYLHLFCAVCPCGCGRMAAYDQFFATSMATGMQGYERTLTPVKEALFQAVTAQRTDLQRKVDVLEVGIGTAPNLRFYATQVHSPDTICWALSQKPCRAMLSPSE
jgi:hypothetical protein